MELILKKTLLITSILFSSLFLISCSEENTITQSESSDVSLLKSSSHSAKGQGKLGASDLPFSFNIRGNDGEMEGHFQIHPGKGKVIKMETKDGRIVREIRSFTDENNVQSLYTVYHIWFNGPTPNPMPGIGIDDTYYSKFSCKFIDNPKDEDSFNITFSDDVSSTSYTGTGKFKIKL
jgi:hypothetical protein